jgi:SpoVK/Ycf46/Vps4 family AAA+-type ATPase
MAGGEEQEWGRQGPPYHELLQDCQELYRTCAQEYAEQHAELIQDTPQAFVSRMVELHRGLVLKVFVEMAQADMRIGPAELRLAQELFAHAWGRHLSEPQVKEALDHYGETTHLRWESLLRPFERFSTFARRKADLQQLVEQMAWRVAQASGRIDSRSVRHLQWIRAELRRILDRVPLAPDSLPPRRKATLPTTPIKGAVQVADFEITSASVAQEAQVQRIQQRVESEQLSDVLEELEALIGLDSIKQDMHELVNFLKIQAERVKHDLPRTPISLHAVFSGNPGTGKTTVARFFGRILGAMGILAKGHLIETDRSGLVAEFAGQTAPKTNKRIDEALDGVLFIDEAYSLVAETGDDPYGAEALQTLLKRMEDNRDRLVVILAGYPRSMEQLLRKNPGLASRFNRTFVFPDYKLTELGEIFGTMCARDHYKLPSTTRARLLLGFRHLLAHRDEQFGNGRLVRNVFERSVRRLANRLASITPLTRELLTTLQPEDIVMEKVPAEVWTAQGSGRCSFHVACPKCRITRRIAEQHLGRKMQCNRCGQNFTADWGEVWTSE